MMEKITIFLCLFAITVVAKRNHCICPCTEINSENLPNGQAQQLKTVLSLIDLDLPRVTDLGKCYLELLKTYLSGDDDVLQKHVINTIVYQNSLQAYLSGQDGACNIAQIIDATVDCFESGSPCSILKAIPNMAISIHQSVNYYGLLNQQASGCQMPEVKKPQLKSSTCFNNGYTYRIKDIWELKGKHLPTELRHIVMKLYKSCHTTDNYMALIATNSLVPISVMTTSTMNLFPAGVEYINMQVDSKIPCCCCTGRFERIDQLNNQINGDIDRIVNDQLKIYQAPGACCSPHIKKRKRKHSHHIRF